MNAPKIMVVGDEGPLSVLLKFHLEDEGYQVEICDRDQDAESRLQEDLPDLLVASGIELGQRLRSRPETKRLPIVWLTEPGEQGRRTRGPSTGIDDYLTKPFSAPELIVRVRALLRRIKPEVLSDVLTVLDVTLDRQQHQVFRNGRPIQLSPTEFRLLELMMQHPGRVFSREELVDSIWGSEYGEGRALEVLIVRLRKSLNATSNVDPIRTIRGAGYAIGGVKLELTAVR